MKDFLARRRANSNVWVVSTLLYELHDVFNNLAYPAWSVLFMQLRLTVLGLLELCGLKVMTPERARKLRDRIKQYRNLYCFQERTSPGGSLFARSQ